MNIIKPIYLIRREIMTTNEYEVINRDMNGELIPDLSKVELPQELQNEIYIIISGGERN